MAFKYKLSTRGMVLYILNIYPGEALSAKDIQGKILHHFEYKIKRQTIVSALDESDHVTGTIVERTERRGILKHPTKVFSVHYKNTEI